jgi:hypothetical protein
MATKPRLSPIRDGVSRDHPRNGNHSVLRPPVTRTVRRNVRATSYSSPGQRKSQAMSDLRRYPRTSVYVVVISLILAAMNFPWIL